jgi:anti-sigma-K factor RskA
MTSRDELHVLTGGYAVHALEHHERQAFERHLQGCDSCEAEVRAFRETAARLAMARSLQPPAGMEQRVLAATYRTRQLPPLPARERGARWRPGAGRRWARMPGMPRLAVAVAAASVVAALALGGLQVVTQQRLDSARASGAAIARVLGASDARIETMATSEGGTVTVIVSDQQRDALVSTSGMTAPPDGRVYQLWVIDAYGARSAGLLPAAGPTGPVLASGVLRGDRIGITVEPSGGTSRPTTTPIVMLPA